MIKDKELFGLTIGPGSGVPVYIGLPEQKEAWQEVEEFMMVKSSLLDEKVSATGALAKLNQDKLDALASVVGTSFFKGDRK